MKNKYGIYLNNGKKLHLGALAGGYLQGFICMKDFNKSKYITVEGYEKYSPPITQLMCNAKEFPTEESAINYIKYMGWENNTSVKTGLITAYIVHLLS